MSLSKYESNIDLHGDGVGEKGFLPTVMSMGN